MNTRGMLEVIVLNIGLEAGIINQKLYTMLMVMSLVNTVVTVPVLKYVYPLVGLREDNLEKGSSKPGNAAAGKAIADDCAACHGKLGISDDGSVPNLAGRTLAAANSST